MRNGRDLFWCYNINEPFLLESADDWQNWLCPRCDTTWPAEESNWPCHAWMTHVRKP